MFRINPTFIVCGACLFASGCDKKEVASSTGAGAVPQRALEPISDAAKPKAPPTGDLFGADTAPVKADVPKIENWADAEGGMKMEMTVMQQPKYYTGPMPLKFVSTKRTLGLGRYFAAVNNFGDFKVEYAYSDPAMQLSGLADGARAVDADGKTLAVAKLAEIEKGAAVVVEEFHFNRDGTVKFTCRSKFELGLGDKKSETDARGTKHRDFFFLWPTTGF